MFRTLIFGLLLSATAANAQSLVHSAKDSSNDNQRDIVPIENFFPARDFSGADELRHIARAIEQQLADAESPEEQSRAERSAKSGEKVANWTPWIFGAAFAEMIITGFGVILLAKTLGHTRRSADAAEGTFKETRDNARLELRAYLSVEPAGINKLAGHENDVIGHVTVRNVGKLPARHVDVIVKMIVLSSRNFVPTELSDNPDVSRTIQPGAYMRQGSKDYSTLLAVRGPTNQVFVWGIVRYDDGYGNRRFTKFCHRYAGASHFRQIDWGSPNLPEIPGTIIEIDKARYFERHNDSD